MEESFSNDAFSLFGLPRQPWLDAAELRDEFHRRSASLHPDAGGDAVSFARMNTAYAILREPAARLRHLLEMTVPESPVPQSQIPGSLADRFLRSAAVRQSATAFLATLRAASSPLARALLAEEHSKQTQAVHATIAELEAAQAEALVGVREIDQDWTSRLPELTNLQAELSYLEKWLAGLRAAHLELTLAGAS